jgi:hypothetical protein
MGKTILVEEDITCSKKLIKRLETDQFKVNSAFWLYFPELEEWKLVISTDFIDKCGPRKAYSFVQDKLEKIKPRIISLNDINIVGKNYELIESKRYVLISADARKTAGNFLNMAEV